MSEIAKIPGLKPVLEAVSEVARGFLHGMLILPEGPDTFVSESDLERRCGKATQALIVDPAQIHCRATAFDRAMVEKFPENALERRWNQLIISALSVFETTSATQITGIPPLDFKNGLIPIPTLDERHTGRVVTVPYYPPTPLHSPGNTVIWL